MARIIKRYDNRKLYDTEASSYVSQRDVAELVRDGETVRIVDNSTGEDLTAQTLTQIILEEGKEHGHGLLPTDTLHGLLRRGGEAAGHALGEGARQVGQGLAQVKSNLDDLVGQSLARLNRLTRSDAEDEARASEVEALHDQLARLEARLAEVLDRVEDGGPPTADGGNPSTINDAPSNAPEP